MRWVAWLAVIGLVPGCGLIAGLGSFKDAPTTTGTGGSGGSTGNTGGAGGGDGGLRCGNGVAEGTEQCDGVDLKQQDCTSLQLGFTGGTLACNIACGFDTSKCTAVVTPPVLRSPANGARVGSVNKPGSMRPTFRWEASSTTPPTAVTYRVQYSPNPDFSQPLTESDPLTATEHTPAADLPAQTLDLPYGTRLFWKVKACTPNDDCAESAVRRLWVGRSRHDYDGDGYADVLASGLGGNGRVSVIRGQGGTTISMTPAWSTTGKATGDFFGYALSSAGDVNGDGYADVLVGAPNEDAATVDQGSVYLYRGGPSGPFSGAPISLQFALGVGVQQGLWAAGIGDVNGDGYDDVATGRHYWGCAFLFFGGPGGLKTGNPLSSNWKILGQSAVGVGDVNGDGYDDVVTADDVHPDMVAKGSVFLFPGGPNPNPDSCDNVAFATGNGNDHLGGKIASGDLNGDGFSDVVLGAYDPGAVNGYAQIWFGGPGGLNKAATLTGNAGTGFGRTVAVGDVNGDGVDDVVVGATNDDAGAGIVYVFHGAKGSTSFDTTADATINEPMAANGDVFGIVSVAGDVNGDGIADIVVGAPGRKASAGAVYLFLGGSLSLAGSADGPGGGDQYGWAVAAAGRLPTRRGGLWWPTRIRM